MVAPLKDLVTCGSLRAQLIRGRCDGPCDAITDRYSRTSRNIGSRQIDRHISDRDNRERRRYRNAADRAVVPQHDDNV